MKKLIVCFALAAFAAMPVFAGEKCSKNKATCADKDKVACAGKSECSKTPSKQSLLSPKAAEAKKS
ncbi:MAG: hypothetical protein ABI042_00105 [Verrucomicrobiota bacterium]